ncbi:MAG: tetratricopeptide repeat protein [Terriglobia bacterium]
MGRTRSLRVLGVAVLALAAGAAALGSPRRKQKSDQAIVVVKTQQGCRVDLDGTPEGPINSQGRVVINGVGPLDHYIHVDCPGQPEITRLISPGPGATVELNPKITPESGGAIGLPLGTESNVELRGLITQATNQRSNGQFPQAVQTLRRAVILDPDNPDLHHELGITFLMIRDWEDARVELLEALHHNPGDADAHNGLGYALEKLGQIRPALDQFRLAMHLDPSDDLYQEHYLEALGLLSSEQAQHKKKKRF